MGADPVGITWPAHVVVSQKLQGSTLHCIWSAGTAPGHWLLLTACPTSFTHTVVLFLTPPPQDRLQLPQGPTCVQHSS